MAKENQIVGVINAAIKSVLTDARFNGAQYGGITTLLNKEENPMPCEIDNDGRCNWISIDNSKPIQLYHRNNGGQFSIDPTKQFGDGGTRKQNTSMSLFVIANRTKIKMPVEDILVIIASGFPSQPTKEKRHELTIQDCNISIQSFDLNTLAIFKREQSNQKTFDPQIIMFELKYLIECGFSNSCINTICC